MKDNFKLWEPGGDEPKNKYLEGFSDGYNGLNILLKGLREDKKVLKIIFKTYLAFRSANESYRLKTLHEGGFTNGINFSTDSKFLNWVKEETHGIYNNLNLVHYLICTNDDITDIVSADEPTLGWVED